MVLTPTQQKARELAERISQQSGGACFECLLAVETTLVEALLAARSEGAREMRERCATVAAEFRERGTDWRAGRMLVNSGHRDRDAAIADAIRALSETP